MAKYIFSVFVIAFCLSSVLASTYLGRRDRRLGNNAARSQASAAASASSRTHGHGLSSSSAQASAAAESFSQGGRCYDECQSWEDYCYCNYDFNCQSTVCRRDGSILPRVNPLRPRVNPIRRSHVGQIRPRVPVCRRNTLSVLGACRHFDECQYESDCRHGQTCCYDRTCGYNVCQLESRRGYW